VGHERVLSAFCDNCVAVENSPMPSKRPGASVFFMRRTLTSSPGVGSSDPIKVNVRRHVVARRSTRFGPCRVGNSSLRICHATQRKAGRALFLSHEIGAPACTDIAQVCLIIKQEKRCLYFILILGLCAFCLLPFARSRRRSSREGDIHGPRKTVFSNPSCGPGHSEVYRCFSTRNARRVR